MKGIILPFATTILTAVIAIAVLLAGIFGFMLTSIDTGKIENRFQFLNVLNRPYILTGVLTNLKLYDRMLVEHAIESVVTGSPEKSNSDMEILRVFFEKYNFDAYAVSIENEDGAVFYIDSFPKKCGSDEQSTCVRKRTNQAGPCGVGCVEIVSDMCSSNEVCCEENTAEYSIPSDALDVVACGGVGVCTSKPQALGIFGFNILYSKDCGAGRVLIEEAASECNIAGVNGGKTPICCAPIEKIGETRFAGTAELPLLFKGKTLYEPKTYFCQDTSEECENGAYVSNLCLNQGPDVKCCVNEAIHCKPPNNAAYCLDFTNCPPGKNLGDELCPGQANFVCCDITDEEWDNMKGAASNAEPKAFCQISGDAYNAEPPLGKLRVTISER